MEQFERQSLIDLFTKRAVAIDEGDEEMRRYLEGWIDGYALAISISETELVALADDAGFAVTWQTATATAPPTATPAGHPTG